MVYMSKPYIITGMSGGVDSSVAAKILLEQGFRVEGLFMKNWQETDDVAYCTAKEDLEDALHVCDELEIPLHQVNFSKQYWDRVFIHFLEEYKMGRTPNPDIICNQEIKFKAFLDYAIKLGADKIATGHYAKIDFTGTTYRLLQGTDTNKDQSYFLYRLGQHELSKSLFPLGTFDKSDVRKIAMASGFTNHEKKDSTGICFIGERRFRDFLAQYLPAKPGKILDTDGNIIGQHQGAMYYTIGQRQGLGIGGRRNTNESAWYVITKDVRQNTLTVAQGHNHTMLLKSSLIANQLHWISGIKPEIPFRCAAKIRYRQKQQQCKIETMDYDDRCTVKFDTPQRAITEGQSIVFYSEEICLGGGIIEQVSD